MRYFYEPKKLYFNNYGVTYACNHPVYARATLYLHAGKGLCVIQQRYDNETKATFWTEIDPWLTDDLYLHEGFWEYFKKHAKEPHSGLYPTVTIRQIMWALKLKPLKKEAWETVFDRSPI